jgi:ABC-type Co2+ transport system permease subunit
VAVRAFRTEVRFDWGSLVHFVYGLLSGWLGPWQSAVAAAVFLFKQAVDVRGGERSEEASGDVAEFAAGLLAGWLVARLGEALQLSVYLQLKVLALAAGAALVAAAVLHGQRVRFHQDSSARELPSKSPSG